MGKEERERARASEKEKDLISLFPTKSPDKAQTNLQAERELFINKNNDNAINLHCIGNVRHLSGMVASLHRRFHEFCLVYRLTKLSLIIINHASLVYCMTKTARATRRNRSKSDRDSLNVVQLYY